MSFEEKREQVAPLVADLGLLYVFHIVFKVVNGLLYGSKVLSCIVQDSFRLLFSPAVLNFRCQGSVLCHLCCAINDAPRSPCGPSDLQFVEFFLLSPDKYEKRRAFCKLFYRLWAPKASAAAAPAASCVIDFLFLFKSSVFLVIAVSPLRLSPHVNFRLFEDFRKIVKSAPVNVQGFRKGHYNFYQFN